MTKLYLQDFNFSATATALTSVSSCRQLLPAVDSFGSLGKLSTAESEPSRNQSKAQEQEWLSDRKARQGNDVFLWGGLS